MVCSLVLCLCLPEVGGVGTNPSLLPLEAPSCLCLSLNLFLLPLTRDRLVVGTKLGVTESPPLLAGKLAKLGEAAFVPGALGTGVGVIRGSVDLKVVTVGPLGVVTAPDVFCFKVCFCNILFIALQ